MGNGCRVCGNHLYQLSNISVSQKDSKIKRALKTENLFFLAPWHFILVLQIIWLYIFRLLCPAPKFKFCHFIAKCLILRLKNSQIIPMIEIFKSNSHIYPVSSSLIISRIQVTRQKQNEDSSKAANATPRCCFSFFNTFLNL